MKKLGRTGKIIFYFAILLIILLAICLILLINNAKKSTIETSEINFNHDLKDLEISVDEIQEETADITEETDNIEKVEIQKTQEKPQETVQATETNSKNSSTLTKTVAQTTKDNVKPQTKTSTTSSKTQTAPSTKKEEQCTKSSAPTSTIKENVSSSTKQDSIKRFTQAEIDAEKSKYLSDIKSIAPGLNYAYGKRGQVFWPYRTSEISVFTHNLNFGTIYYYVDIFVEGGQEKFKYYIDWDI